VRDGLEGLIHISELSHQRVAHPSDVVHEGQVLKLKIISLDSERHRLGLSLKQAEEPPERPATPEKERRPRQERPRGFAVGDAIVEPEGGLDTTIASAFAQIREQMASTTEDGSEAPVEAATQTEVAEVAAEPEPAVEPEPEPEAEVEAVAEVAAEPERAVEPEPEPEAVADTEEPEKTPEA
jgi:predicted RNA-binding protein with RPS1 domain